MFRPILINGLIAGLIVGVPMFLMGVMLGGHIEGPLGPVIGYALMLIAFTTVFLAVKRQRDVVQGGVIRFWPAFGLGLAISAIASIIYVGAWELTLAVTGMDFAGDYVAGLVEQKKASGVTGAELAAFEAQMARFVRDYANPLMRLPMTFTEIFPVGALASLITAALLRNARFMPARRTADIAQT
jgi:hypothetical protein